LLSILPDIRADERRLTLAAFLTLLGVMTGHALLETARDALFLARLSPTRLPWVYLAIAGVSVMLFAWQQQAASGPGNRNSLRNLLCGSALVTFGFWLLVRGHATWALYALYIWTGIFATLVIVRFWILAGDLFTVSQAKRLFAFIGAGSAVGAISGAMLARVLTVALPAQHLLLAATGMLLLTALGPLRLLPELDGQESRPPSSGAGTSEVARSLRIVWNQPFLRRLAGIVLVSTVTVTLVDFLFKSAVARNVEADELGAFFAGAYLWLSVLGLVAQLLLVGPLLRRLGVSRVLSLLPALLMLGAVGVAAVGGLLAAFLLKSFDGALRHSLHRTATEVLFVPLAGELRSRVKGVVDVIGQRGGQALASLGILATIAVGHAELILGLVVIALAAAWIRIAISLQTHYLALFRETLDEVALRTNLEFPGLDLTSLEALIAALSSPHDDEVLAAIDLLAQQDRVRLIPALIFYHPSARVVVRALELFTRAAREDFLPLTSRLLEHPEPDVRAATLRSLAWMAPNPELYPRFVNDSSSIVRSTALVGMVSFGTESAERADQEIRSLARGGSSEERLALARAIRFSPGAAFADVMLLLAAGRETPVRLAVARGMREILSPRFVPPLLEMLPHRGLRREARHTLAAMGLAALSELDRALADPDLDRNVRRQLPRAIGDFEPGPAAETLMRRFPIETDGGIRYRILRALGRLKARHSEVELDAEILGVAAEETLAMVFSLMNWRELLAQGALEDPARATHVQEMMLTLLEHREALALERLFRLLSLLHPDQDLRSIYRGTRSAKKDLRASSRELLETLLRPPMRDPVLALVDDLPDSGKLAGAGRYLPPMRHEYEAVLMSLLERGGVALRCLVAYQAGELRLIGLRPHLERLLDEPRGPVPQVAERALSMLSAPAAAEADRGH
jgi:AAA family ATP:ADP antiporter